jgi:Gas vesicle protein
LADLVVPSRGHGLVDILDRVLDKGLVIAGDIKVNLANVELLTIQVRLLICSIDKAEQIGLNWWRHDTRLTATPESRALASDVDARLERIEHRLAELAARSDAGPPRRRPKP